MASDVHRIVPSRPMTCAETSVHSSGKIGGSSLTPLPHRKPASAPKRSQMIVDFVTKPPPVSLEVAGRACRSGNEFNGLPFFLFSSAFGGREVGSRLKITDRAAANGLAFVDEERRFLVHDIVGALCPHNKLLQRLESKQRQQATNPARCHHRIGGTNPAGSAKSASLLRARSTNGQVRSKRVGFRSIETKSEAGSRAMSGSPDLR